MATRFTIRWYRDLVPAAQLITTNNTHCSKPRKNGNMRKDDDGEDDGLAQDANNGHKFLRSCLADPRPTVPQ